MADVGRTGIFCRRPVDEAQVHLIGVALDPRLSGPGTDLRRRPCARAQAHVGRVGHAVRRRGDLFVRFKPPLDTDAVA